MGFWTPLSHGIIHTSVKQQLTTIQINDAKNLTVMVRQRVVRVLFEGTRAVGVEYVSDEIGRIGGVTTTLVAHASKLVVCSAEAFGSPAILERSGIGSQSILEKIGVKVVVDLPGVGENYQDNNLIFAPFVATPDADTLDQIFRGTKEEIQPYEEQWLKDGKGLIAHNGIDSGVKLRPTAKELEEISEEFGETWKNYFADAPDKPVTVYLPFAGYAGANPAVPRGKYFSIAYFSGYPISLGYVHITSGLDPYAKSDFHPGFLDQPADLAILRWTCKKSRELARRMDFHAGDLVVGHPNFKEGSKAATNGSCEPAATTEADIVYTKEDDDAIDIYHRENVETTWHSIGTCAMKPQEQGGVVDVGLNVYGVQGLKVAVCLRNFGANTYNTAIAIGEKAAVIIAEDLGIQGVSAGEF